MERSIGPVRSRKTSDLLAVGIIFALVLATSGILTLATAATLVLSAAEQIAPGCTMPTSPPAAAAQTAAHL